MGINRRVVVGRTRGCTVVRAVHHGGAAGRRSAMALWSIPEAETSWGGPGGRVPLLAKRRAFGWRIWGVTAVCDQRLRLLPVDGRVDGRTGSCTVVACSAVVGSQ